MEILHFNVRKQIDQMMVDLFPSIIKMEDEVFLIDCGYEETYIEFREAIKDLGISKIDSIIISHDDIDHLGALKMFKDDDPSIKIYCSDVEKDSVEGIVRSERLIQAENSLIHLPTEYTSWALGFIAQLEQIKRVRVDETLGDGDWLANQIQVIHTPGHTSGHISLFIPSEETVIANDALVIEDGTFNIANPQFCLDLPMALRSVEKIKELHPRKVICYHGGIMEQGVDNKLQQLLDRFNK